MDSIAALCADSQWAELVERARSTTDIFDIISIRETQHSDMLAWMFNAREGHGQNDAIFRDFLLAVYEAGSLEAPADRIKGKGLTVDFVRGWTPTRIMTTSFASAMFFREYRLPGTKEDEGTCILDLLVVDPENKFIIAIENKAGARLTRDQLGKYVTRLSASRLSRGAFSAFDMAFVALDRDFNDDPEAVGCDPRWAWLSYAWLERAARRAELAEQRGNGDASIVLSYARQQFDYRSPNIREIDRLARALANRHPGAVSELRKEDAFLRDPIDWTAAKLAATGSKGQLLRLFHQHRDACEELLGLTRLDMLHGAILDAEQSDELDDLDRVDMRRSHVSYRPLHSIPSTSDFWPLFVRAALKANEIHVFIRWRPRLVVLEHRGKYAALLESKFRRKKLSLNGGSLLTEKFTDIDQACDAVLRMLRVCDALCAELAEL
ncbi:PD-(D/E)XK nuclease family protein [Stenotrophomonas sp. B1-1]|uniref:PDDEXK-like family protein n=1 Tax=Stenotrophomonas sp. B1-1 TaxID=2710648 RepID=UPI0013DC1CE0|nr:PD-(D/E)XK nuclease family protein [Stenotrophomonas sp. B1-1]